MIEVTTKQFYTFFGKIFLTASKYNPKFEFEGGETRSSIKHFLSVLSVLSISIFTQTVRLNGTSEWVSVYIWPLMTAYSVLKAYIKVLIGFSRCYSILYA